MRVWIGVGKHQLPPEDANQRIGCLQLLGENGI
jgi:hypothetical protein